MTNKSTSKTVDSFPELTPEQRKYHFDKEIEMLKLKNEIQHLFASRMIDKIEREVRQCQP